MNLKKKKKKGWKVYDGGIMGKLPRIDTFRVNREMVEDMKKLVLALQSLLKEMEELIQERD